MRLALLFCFHNDFSVPLLQLRLDLTLNGFGIQGKFILYCLSGTKTDKQCILPSFRQSRFLPIPIFLFFLPPLRPPQYSTVLNTLSARSDFRERQRRNRLRPVLSYVICLGISSFSVYSLIKDTIQFIHPLTLEERRVNVESLPT